MSNKSYGYMELNGFIGEEKINEFYFSHQITDQQYVKHHSQEMLDAYNSYLQDHGLEDSEESASRYLDEDDCVAMLEMEEENEMEEEATPAISQSSIEVYENWKQDVEMTNSLLADNTTAAKIALWRYKNPTSEDKHLCAEETATDDATVEKWWLTIDFICGSIGGTSFKLASPTLQNMETLISNATIDILG
mgnify:FL=1